MNTAISFREAGFGQLVLAALSAALLLSGGVRSQEKKPEAKQAKADVAEAGRAARAVAEAIGLRGPVDILVGAWAGAPSWGKPSGKKEPPKVTQLFDKYQVQDGAPLPLWNDEASETQLYCYLLNLAQQVERSTFERVARKDVRYEDAFDHPEKYRGEVIHVEGFLRKMRRIETPPRLAVERGVSTLYLGWIFDPKNPNVTQPWYVVFTHDPGRMQSTGPLNRRVTFDGYFFKRLRFEVEDSWFNAPLVIGHTPALVRELPNDVAYRQRGAVAAAGVSFLGGPFQIAGPLSTGVYNQTWPAIEPKPWQEKQPDVAVKLDLSPYTIIDGEPVLSYAADPSPSSEALAHANVLAIAHKQSQEAIFKGARRDVTRAHMMNQCEKYRGEVVHVEGTLARIRRFDPTTFGREAGITDEYEAWVFDSKQYGANPICLYVTEVPSEIKEKIERGEAERLLLPVKFDGYFFKRYRYKTGERNNNKDVWRDAPLLIGKTIVFPPPAPAEEQTEITKGMMMLFLGVLLGTMSLALGVAFFYRRGDQAIRARVAGASALSFGEPAPGETKTEPTGADPSQFSGFPRSTEN
ncbi:hypothetical protein AYO40_05510 [Planctomycetaceae bacterium SCGC AG-212-D15]|nr:hypothetical protein AYO40_05510 [Planctomycetaceae bacterium SCGC AG-212-D15]